MTHKAHNSNSRYIQHQSNKQYIIKTDPLADILNNINKNPTVYANVQTPNKTIVMDKTMNK